MPIIIAAIAAILVYVSLALFDRALRREVRRRYKERINFYCDCLTDYDLRLELKYKMEERLECGYQHCLHCGCRVGPHHSDYTTFEYNFKSGKVITIHLCNKHAMEFAGLESTND